MKVVVSGASGLIGSALVPALEREGHEVVRLVRREAVGADEIRWDPAAGELDAAAPRGVDAIVNLSGANIGRRWTASSKREILESRVDRHEPARADGRGSSSPARRSSSAPAASGSTATAATRS